MRLSVTLVVVQVETGQGSEYYRTRTRFWEHLASHTGGGLKYIGVSGIFFPTYTPGSLAIGYYWYPTWRAVFGRFVSISRWYPQGVFVTADW